MVYQVYLMAQKELHVGLLTRKYEEISLDINEAVAAIRSTGLGMKKNKEKAIALMDDWRRRQETATKVKRSLCITEIKELYEFHKEVLFFLDDFQIHAEGPPWISNEDWAQKHTPIRLTDNETRCFVTGLCRLVIHANIFGKNEDAKDFVPSADDNDWEEVTGAVDAWRLFFGTMPPWEYEEMGCVWSHLITRWEVVLFNAYVAQKDIIEGYETSAKEDNIELSINDDHLRDVGGNPFRKFTWEEFDMPPADVICLGETMIGFTRECVYNGHFFASFGPRFLFRVMHAKPLVRHKMLLSNVNPNIFHPWIGYDAELSREVRFPLVYPAEKYNVGSLDELWSTTSATEEPGSIWRRIVNRLFLAHQDFEAAFVKEHTINDFGGHSPELGWEWQAVIWDEEKLDEWEAYCGDWFEQYYWERAF